MNTKKQNTYKNDYHAEKLPQYRIPFDLIKVLSNHMKPWFDISKDSNMYLERLRKFKQNNKIELNEDNYDEDLNLLLYIEEYQNILDIRQYDMLNQKVTIYKDNLFNIYVKGLEEERPSVTVNTFVEVIDTETKNSFTLKVHKVLEQHITAKADEKFCKQFREDNLYDIKFMFNNYPFRCCHYALSVKKKFKLAPYVFPVGSQEHCESNTKLDWFNKAVANNPQQKRAVLNIICKSSFPASYILYGPPGTGKTSTVVEAICQVSKKNPSNRILVCTPSNTSADVITKHLLKYIPDPKRNLHRMYSYSKDVSTIDEDILNYCNCIKNNDGEKIIIMLPAEKLPKIIVTTLCTSTRLLFLSLPMSDFPYIFIDEAGQATEPESVIPFTLLSRIAVGYQREFFNGQIILAGDPKQLGPVITSRIAKCILGKSMMERLMTLKLYRKDRYNTYNPKYITKLVINYRSHPSIIHVSNKLFYTNELKPCNENYVRKGEGWRYLPKSQFPIIFEGVYGIENRNNKSPSVYNVDEQWKIWYYVNLLIGSKLGNTTIKQEDIGIITPFTAQKVRVRKMLKNENLTDIEIGTIQLFQGKEKEVIILSTVRSEKFYHDGREHIGFLSDPRQFNVALTRAKYLLIVIGHPAILQVDYNWWYFLKYCIQNYAYRGNSFDLKKESNIFMQRNPKRSKRSKKRATNNRDNAIPDNTKSSNVTQNFNFFRDELKIQNTSVNEKTNNISVLSSSFENANCNKTEIIIEKAEDIDKSFKCSVL